tara:strand:+ start:262 stop:954 length:693 start_codon:yes stop_codon:yes gene_type:complete
MAKEYKLEIEKRELSENVKHLRNAGGIPGVYYSHDSKNSILFKMNESELRNAVKSGAAIFQVSVGGELRNVIFKSVQYHPVKETPQHIDLYGVDMNVAINIRVPLEIIGIGECKGVKEDGGVINTPLTEIEVSCLPSNIPQSIEVDVTELHLGDSLQAENLDLDETLTLITRLDATVASITHAAVEVEPEVEDEGLEEGVEGEEADVEGADDSDSKESDDSAGKSEDSDS